MRISGACFGFEVPNAWARDDSLPGITIAAGEPPEEAPFAPNAVLRESRLVTPQPTALAALSQANLRAAYEEIDDIQVVQVEAIPEPDSPLMERRRMWALAPVALAEAVTTVLMVQDLFVAGDAVAELTVTVPLASDWQVPADILDTLHPLPRNQRKTPATTASPGDVELDGWITARDGAPREALPPAPTRPLPLRGEITLHADALAELSNYALAGEFLRRFRKLQHPGLAAAGLVENTTPTASGKRILHFMRIGAPWEIELTAQGYQCRFLAFGLGKTTLVAHSSPDAPSRYRMGFTQTTEMSRHALRWTKTASAWPLRFDEALTTDELEKTSENGPLDRHEGDFAEFCRQPWVLAAVREKLSEEGYGWITTPNRGAAMLSPEKRFLRPRRTVLGTSSRVPLWQILTLSALTLSLGNGLRDVFDE